MPHLISVSLQNSTSISDAGLAALAKLKPLKSLNLKGCRDVTDQGLAALKTLQQLTFLRIQVRLQCALLKWQIGLACKCILGFPVAFTLLSTIS